MNKTILLCVAMICFTFVMTNYLKAVRENNNIQLQLEFARGQQMGGVGDTMNRRPKI